MGWLPQIFRDAGISADTARDCSSPSPWRSACPLSFVLPALAGRMRSQGGLAVALAVFGLVGYVGLWLAPAALPLAVGIPDRHGQLLLPAGAHHDRHAHAHGTSAWCGCPPSRSAVAT